MKKRIAMILSVLLCASLLLSVCMIGHTADHNCIGENCQVCSDLALQRQHLQSVLCCVLFCGVLVCIFHLTVFLSLFVSTEKLRLNLVVNKVKLTA